MKIKGVLGLLFAVSTAVAVGQTTLSTPSVNDQNCVGQNCATQPTQPTNQPVTQPSYPPVTQSTTGPSMIPATGQPVGQSVQQIPSSLTNLNQTVGVSPTTGVQGASPMGTQPPNLINPQAPNTSVEVVSDFQKFVAASTGQDLPIYGRNLFDAVPSTFAPLDRTPVPSNYTIGPGDELLIRAWGQIDLDGKVTVDRNGEIFLPKVGAIRVAGLHFDQLSAYLKANIGRLFKSFDLNVNIGQLRSIQIFVVGQASRPGTYTISSLSTLVNALFASGGPNATGSMRQIQLKRQDKVVSEFDLYDLLIRGDKSKDVTLQPGDVIYIPPAGPMAALIGSVNLPAIYELRADRTVGDLIDLAGGLSTTADNGRVLLERIDDRKTRSVEEFLLDQAGLARKVQDGDVLRIFPISPRFENAVTLRGNVAQPGRYPWKTGMRIRNLIPSVDALVTRDYWTRQNVMGVSTTTWTSSDPGKTSLVRNPTEINWDYAVVQRLNPVDLSTQLISFNLGHAITDANSEDNIVLEAGDVVTIFSQADVQVPVDQRSKYVRIDGEVKAAGLYRVRAGETLRDVLARAGGLTSKAYVYASEFRRESTKVEQQQRLDEAVAEMDKELQSQAASLAGSGGSGEEVAAAKQQLAAERSLLDRMKNVVPTGRVVLELKPTDSGIDAFPPLELEDGDALYIPPQPATVQVIGSVYNQSAFIYRSDSTVGSYLRQSGGPTRDGDSGRTFVVRADGSVVSKQMHRSIWSGGFESLRITPGDSIVVPQKIHGPSFIKSFKDWTQIFAQMAIGIASIKVLTD